ncbi:hypothetical protein MNBD_UNCLBAC01-627 [hydrothermal vent metagenome]|uniref:Uncharacterized protein n=1 Tax=hydrothermal vent metagenome TaxID=652676 RepID=A0A3B1DHE3_9ZZZZ
MNLFSVFVLGLEAAINPLALTTFLLFYRYLADVGKTKKLIIFAGLFFILAVFLVCFLSTIGFGDYIFRQSIILMTVRGIYLSIASVLITFGFLNFIDWRLYWQSQDIKSCRLKAPVFWGEEQKSVKSAKAFFNILYRIFISFIVGAVLMLLVLVWPQDEQIFVIFSSVVAKTESKFAILLLVVYSVAFVLPLVCVWVMVLWVAFNQKAQTLLEKFVSQRKIIFSAIFFSVGLGLMYFVIISLNQVNFNIKELKNECSSCRSAVGR